MGIHVRVTPSGRVSIPADMRRALGLAKGGTVIFEQGEFGLTISTPEQRVEQAQAMVREIMKGKPRFTVDDFIAVKRAEAAREAAEY